VAIPTEYAPIWKIPASKSSRKENEGFTLDPRQEPEARRGMPGEVSTVLGVYSSSYIYPN
jgi:hypothetical protein